MPPPSKIAVKVGHQRADVAHGEVLGLEMVGVFLDLAGPVALVALVDAVELGRLWDADIGMGQQEFADRLVEREAMHAVARAVDQHGAGAVEDIAGGHDVAPGLQAVVDSAPCPIWRLAAHDGKDGADADRIVDVGGAIQRVKDQHVVARVGIDPGWGLCSGFLQMP